MSTTNLATPGGPSLSHRQVLTILSGLMLGMLLAALDQTIVSTALPSIVERPAGPLAHLVGGHGVPAHDHRDDTAVGKAR